ncbi:TetR/AcrR family transcriptional regulator [Amycolatopsis acidiphila]|uniref:TetR/AcrR family transcriptional regulator n=1 Tax=Amycolatopsis acidiphila TaxID=715473 RepID=A0A558A0B2_9PSEU|nr:TetR/AcrR family transcriptional regulator [Amycolatopsis acidiphila]TVT17691.1 TetR/AcrR family transcriptional regulator [Amycolatopsis acidiphila]UIJ59060.1 TetR/AcrR family transcriptional regulator [Amycolatopsis acidiphila]GHG96034.1 TetR family transcriptional regulator [Amycolatopsis acidiphila]
MAGRRSDTRERIQQVALDLFVEQGYEKTSLREIAEKLDVTKAALYYHFRTKEDIVASLLDDLAGSVDEVLEWAREQPDQGEARAELIRRLAQLIAGRLGPIMRFMQENQPALKDFADRNPLITRMKELFTIIAAGEREPAAQLRARLSLVALLLGNHPRFLEETGGVAQPEAALQVALELASPRGRGAGEAT